MFHLFLIVILERLAQVTTPLVVSLPWSLRPLLLQNSTNVNMQQWNEFSLGWKWQVLHLPEHLRTYTTASLWRREYAITWHQHSNSQKVLAQDYTEKPSCTSHFIHRNINAHLYRQQHGMSMTPRDRQAAMHHSTNDSRYHRLRNNDFLIYGNRSCAWPKLAWPKLTIT